MSDFEPPNAERLERVVVHVKGARDGEVTRDLLVRDGLEVTLCPDVGELCVEVTKGAAVVLLAEEVLNAEAIKQLEDLLRHQPP